MANSGRLGYCTSCMQNIPHVNQIRNPVLRCLNVATGRFAQVFRIGCWYCIQCGRRSFRLAGNRRHAPEFRPNQGSWVQDDQSSIGNFIRTDFSLVLRRARAERHSVKYRDSIVERLISGTTTISQLGRQLSISEVDVVDWVADMIARKQERIEELESLLELMKYSHSTRRLAGPQDKSVQDEPIAPR